MDLKMENLNLLKMDKIKIEPDRENMMAVLEVQDWWKTKFIESLCDEDMLEFGIKQGVWELC